MEVTARAATAADLPVLADLLEAGTTAVVGQRGAALWLAEQAPQPPFDASLQAVLADRAAAVIAGCVDDVPVGVMLLDERWLADGRGVARVGFVFVDPTARDIGVGEVLIDAALAWARERGCIGLDGLALPGDRQVKNLYERSGLTARAIVVHRVLRPDGEAAEG